MIKQEYISDIRIGEFENTVYNFNQNMTVVQVKPFFVLRTSISLDV